MSNENKIRILSAPGPVSYPLLAYKKKYNDIELIFGKEGNNADAIVDSTVSLAKRGLTIDYVTVKKLMVISPTLKEGKIGVWRKGSAADVLARATLDIKKIKGEIVYADDMYELYKMLNEGKVNSATLSIAIAKGQSFEELIGIPGSCGIHINSNEEDVVRIYQEGIRIAKESVEDVAEYIVSNLPIKVRKEFVINTLRNAEFNVEKTKNIDNFYELVRRYSNTN